MESEEQLLEMFEQTTWEEILELVESVVNYDKSDKTVESIINYVYGNNKISFKQWKVLRRHNGYCQRTQDLKFKYGD
jgi:hypothetical protein